MVTRRTLLKSAAFGALSHTLLPRRVSALGNLLESAEAAGQEPHFFLFLQMQGAWDPCLAFDPKDRDATLPNGDKAFDQPYSMAEVRTFGTIPLAPQGFTFGKYADRLAVINGIDMEIDGGHTADAIMSGSLTPRQTNAPYIQAVVGKRQPYLKHCNIPHIYTAYDGNFFSGAYGASTVIANPTDLLAMLGVNSRQSASRLTRLAPLLQDYQQELADRTERRTFQSYVTAVPAAADMLGKLESGNFHPPSDSTTGTGIGQLFGQLFALGIVGAGSWQLGSTYFFDTHANHFATHPMTPALAAIDLLISELAKIPLDAHTSVWERTTVVLSSEFSRTARLNAAAGKDHNVHSNTIVLLGHKVRPGVFGASGTRAIPTGGFEAHAALPVDFATGKPSATGALLKARHIWAGLGAVVGVNINHEFGTDAVPVGFFT